MDTHTRFAFYAAVDRAFEGVVPGNDEFEGMTQVASNKDWLNTAIKEAAEGKDVDNRTGMVRHILAHPAATTQMVRVAAMASADRDPVYGAFVSGVVRLVDPEDSLDLAVALYTGDLTKLIENDWEIERS